MVFGIFGFLLGILLTVIGFFLTFFFPSGMEHQSDEIQMSGIIIGLIFLIFGIVLIVF